MPSPPVPSSSPSSATYFPPLSNPIPETIDSAEWTDAGLRILRTFVEDVNVLFSGTRDAPFCSHPEEAITVGTFQQTNASNWKGETENWLVKRGNLDRQARLSDWQVYMHFEYVFRYGTQYPSSNYPSS